MKRRIPVLFATLFTMTGSTVPCMGACSGGPGTIERVPTLGGSAFWVSSLSQGGGVTGFSQIVDSQESRAFRYGEGLFEGLGTLGGRLSIGYGINSAGVVVGQANLAGDVEAHAFVFEGGRMVDLGTLGGSQSSAVAINEAGQVAGNSHTMDWNTEAFFYENGQMKGLGSLGSGFSYAVALNEKGQVAGDSYNEFWDNRAFLHDGTKMIDLGDLGGGYSAVFGLNDHGVVVGESSLETWEQHAFVYEGGKMRDLGTLDGGNSRALKVNNAGLVIGVSTSEEKVTRGFAYAGGEMVDLGTLGGNYTMPFALNNLGQVVGMSYTPASVLHAFVWQDGVMVDLNSLLPPGSGYELVTAEFINDAGVIVGSGYYHGEACWYKMTAGDQSVPPVAVAGADQTVEWGTVVTLDGGGSHDPDGGALVYEWSAGGTVLGRSALYTGEFPLGLNEVVLKVIDACGMEAQSSLQVVVRDTLAPVIESAGVSPEQISPPNRQMVPVSCVVKVADACDPSPMMRIVSITANETLEPGDVVITGPLTAEVAAKRDAGGEGRVYTITLEATDFSGNTATREVTVTVLKNNGNGNGNGKANAKL